MVQDIVLSNLLQFIGLSWWFWLFFILFPVFESSWLAWRNAEFERNMKFALLEIRMPREIHKSPRAMEQILMAIHNLKGGPGNLPEKWIEGQTVPNFSLEMVSFGGQIHFYVRVPAKQKALVESAFFSYYPDAEITEVEDYVGKLPGTLQDLELQEFDIWGTEMVLDKESAYPIKSYLDFESPDEEKQYDPISAILEVLGKLKKEEFAGVQILLEPIGKEWKTGGKAVLDSLRLKADADKVRTPGETDILKAVEANLAKPAFNTLIRFTYIAPKDAFYDSFARKGLVGAFNQYAALNLNSFKANHAMGTMADIWSAPYVFPSKRVRVRKQRMLHNYINRKTSPQTFVGKLVTSSLWDWNFHGQRSAMNVQSIATIFHPPTHLVLTAPHIKRVESRKAGPPAGLAIYGEDSEIEKYM